MNKDLGVPPTGSGCEASPSAAKEASSQSRIPNAGSVSLKPCPFCGKAPTTMGSGDGQRGLMIECATVGCVNPHVSYYEHEAATRAWNTRVLMLDRDDALADAAPELLAALRQLFEASRIHDPDDWTGEPAMCVADDLLTRLTVRS